MEKRQILWAQNNIFIDFYRIPIEFVKFDLKDVFIISRNGISKKIFLA